MSYKDDKGVSLVLVNTEKGRKLFDAVKHNMHVIPARLEDCLQLNLQRPSAMHPKREAFERDYIKYGFVYVAKKYGDMGWRYQIKRVYRDLCTLLKFY